MPDPYESEEGALHHEDIKKTGRAAGKPAGDIP